MKKSSCRFQELNKQLLEKVKTTEQQMLEREGLTTATTTNADKLKFEKQKADKSL